MFSTGGKCAGWSLFKAESKDSALRAERSAASLCSRMSYLRFQPVTAEKIYDGICRQSHLETCR